MTVTVTFNNISNHVTESGSITVENIGELLFENQGGNLTEMSAEDKQEFNEFIQTITPQQAIEEALEVIAVAPGFDDIPVSDVDAPDVKATVEYTDLENR
jgi:hypothetical protein